MTAAETLEAARNHIEKRQGTIDTWISKETQQTMYGVSYWVWKGKECLGKIMKTGPDLVTVVTFLKEKEQFALANGVVPKMEPPSPPPPLAADSYGYCAGCGATAQRGSLCPSCGVWVY